MVLGEGQSREVIVLLSVEHILAEGNAGSHHLRHSSLYKCPAAYEFRVLKLVADRHLVTGADEFRKVLFYSVMRKSGHRHGSLVSVGASGLDKAQDLACQDCIIRICFIEISYPVQQYRFRVLRFDRKILFQKRCIFRLFLRHLGNRVS